MAIEPLDALRLAWWFRGLSNIELQYAQRTCTIPTHSSYPVMNLSHALAVVCYELFMTASQGLAESRDDSAVRGKSSDAAASLKNVDIFWSQVEDILVESEFLSPQTKTKVRRGEVSLPFSF